jgi:hypothetical protein
MSVFKPLTKNVNGFLISFTVFDNKLMTNNLTVNVD